MSKELRKRMRVSPKNFVFRDEKSAIGIPVPYTRREYAALAAGTKKQVLLFAARVRTYDIIRAQLAVMRILTIADISMVDKLQKLEARLALQRETLPSSSRWRALIKE